jgi:hypothetical protein
MRVELGTKISSFLRFNLVYYLQVNLYSLLFTLDLLNLRNPGISFALLFKIDVFQIVIICNYGVLYIRHTYLNNNNNEIR